MLEIVAATVGRQARAPPKSNMVRYALDKKRMHACRDSFRLAIAKNEAFGLAKRDITHNINFFMNVAHHARARPQLRGRPQRPRQVRGDAGEDECPGPDLQLPAAQQPLQRLQPHAHRGARLDSELTRCGSDSLALLPQVPGRG